MTRGGGIRSTNASSTSSIPTPSLALVRIASVASSPIISSISAARAVDVGAGQIDLVDHRHDFEPVVQRHVNVGERLRLDPLARVDHQQRAFAGGQAARDLVGEIDVAGSIDQVEHVGLCRRAPCS